MRRFYLMGCLAVALVCLCACQKFALSDADASETGARKDVQFVIGGITVEYATRATIQSEGMTDLWVYEGSTLLKHQVSTDSDFGLPTVNLTYGSHDLTFVASKAEGQTFGSAWQCSKVKDTFAKVLNVTVSGGSSTSRQVPLARRINQVCLKIQDAIPASVKKMHLTVGNHLSLNSMLVGGDATLYEATVDVSSRAGQTGYSPVVNILPESATNAENCDVMVEFLDASNAVLYHYERTVEVKANRCTTLMGSYFTGDGYQVTVDNTWLDELVVDL